ncbi:hypothetical protein CJ030_MR0G005145 [Morella rubra]|uniref:Uncharacterized protein n=1 Tax=Morella rubra TaxID=262757 RepID=A0A6A1ULE3_9ROSI|nr:hypothetical protein CJ030_MR0G005145 [Morella rubra]
MAFKRITAASAPCRRAHASLLVSAGGDLRSPSPPVHKRWHVLIQVPHAARVDLMSRTPSGRVSPPPPPTARLSSQDWPLWLLSSLLCCGSALTTTTCRLCCQPLMSSSSQCFHGPFRGLCSFGLASLFKACFFSCFVWSGLVCLSKSKGYARRDAASHEGQVRPLEPLLYFYLP